MFDLAELVKLFPGVVEDQDTPTPDDAGELSVLNCTAGDIHIKFNKDDPQDVENARKIIQDMQRRGYIILVEHEGQTHRVHKFDPKTNEYIVREATEEVPANVVTRVARSDSHKCDKCDKKIKEGESYYESKGRRTHTACGVPEARPRRKVTTRRLPMTRSKATGVAPTAGG